MKNFGFICLSLALVACQDYTPVELTNDELDYNRAFIAEFGQPDQDHDWGFTGQTLVDMSAQTRFVDTNKNLWYYTYQLNIPGYPDADGNFHGTNTTNSDGYLTKTVNESDIPNRGTQNEDRNWVTNNAGQPVGDVTAEEREYVMNWFKTNQNPKSISIHWSEFFVQYIGYNGAGVIKAGEMDQLGSLDLDGNWEHVNNFNNSTKDIQYVRNAGTEAWSYRASHSNSYQEDKFTMQYLSFTLENGHHYEGWYVGLDYESVKYEGDGSLERNSVFADGYYCDWVLKINPGTHLGYPVTTRVMCEDLGHSYDWDYNDVVFDVVFLQESDGVYAQITLRASGGTMPVYVGEKKAKLEVHSLLGDGSMTPIIHATTPVLYKVRLSDIGVTYKSDDNTLNAKEIPIYVENSQATYTINNTAIPQKFACPDDVEWAEELQNICTKYPNVPEWIHNKSMSTSEQVWVQNPEK